MSWNNVRLKAVTTPDARAEHNPEASWRLSIPAGPAGHYRLAQIDDYSELRRRSFPWNAPYQLSLRARASAAVIPGTWGFGLWNDPFGMGILSKVGGRAGRYYRMQPGSSSLLQPTNCHCGMTCRRTGRWQPRSARGIGRRLCWHWERLDWLFWRFRQRHASCAA